MGKTPAFVRYVKKTHKNEGEQLFSTGVSLWLFTNDIVFCILVELLSQVPPQKVQNLSQKVRL